MRGYFDVDLEIVWRTVKHSLPPFVERIRALLERS
ncbi:MAG: HepT-like ribonuclease domain-containing protein [Betaproteobacteria bacterium]